ncbi:MAG: ParB/RepB/Spo0J family partition protein [Ruminococcaceae bacterium]|nr:ParB/RepB/Spo0J family partition protein [Oscillospiraceae bacterium]
MAKPKKSALGGGVNALFQNKTVIEEVKKEVSESVVLINITDIEPGDGQPRKYFDKEKIQQLADSIREHGLIQPIVVSKEGDSYRIIAGERRWRAARVAGLKQIPAIEKNVSRREVLELALIENIQREDLNPIEEAEAYQRLIDEYKMTQEKLSEVVGKSRPFITNKMRLLVLDKDVRLMIIKGDISEGHGRTLLALNDKDNQLVAANLIVENGYSVRQTEELVKKLNKPKKVAVQDNFSDTSFIEVKKIQNDLKNALGTKVKLVDNNGKGKIIIDYFSADERERLIQYLTEKR